MIDPAPGRDRSYPSGGGGGGGANAREILIVNTSSITSGGYLDSTFDIGKGSALLIAVSCTKAGRLRLYATAADRTIDAARGRDTDPKAGRGVLGEFIYVGTGTLYRVSPMILLYNDDSPAATVIYYRFENDGTTGTVTFNFHHVDTEA